MRYINSFWTLAELLNHYDPFNQPEAPQVNVARQEGKPMAFYFGPGLETYEEEF